MASEITIRVDIQSHVTPSLPYSVWTVGVTDNPTRRRGEHGNPNVWYQWNADTEQIARNVEAYFIAKGMNGGPGGAGRANYVYIF